MKTELELAMIMFPDFKIIQSNVPKKVNKMSIQMRNFNIVVDTIKMKKMQKYIRNTFSMGLTADLDKAEELVNLKIRQ